MIRRKIKRLLQRKRNDHLYNAVLYNYHRMKFGYWPRMPDLRNPKTFNEKILYLKIRYRHPGASRLADKHAVREYVRDRVGEGVLVPLHGAYASASEIDFATLPEAFVAKPNHASGMILFGDRKAGFDPDMFRRRMQAWLATDYGAEGFEYQYRGIPRKILIEKDLRHEAGIDDLADYKFFCFNGRPRVIQVDTDRFSAHRRDFYDPDWEKLPFRIFYENRDDLLPPPQGLPEMMEIAATLARDLPFARVDLYNIHGRIYFGEITFHPNGGVEPFSPDRYDRILGSWLQLPAASSSGMRELA